MTAGRLLTLHGRALFALGLAGLGLLGGGLLGRGAAGALLGLLRASDRLDVAVLLGGHGALWRGGAGRWCGSREGEVAGREGLCEPGTPRNHTGLC